MDFVRKQREYVVPQAQHVVKVPTSLDVMFTASSVMKLFCSRLLYKEGQLLKTRQKQAGIVAAKKKTPNEPKGSLIVLELRTARGKVFLNSQLDNPIGSGPAQPSAPSPWSHC